MSLSHPEHDSATSAEPPLPLPVNFSFFAYTTAFVLTALLLLAFLKYLSRLGADKPILSGFAVSQDSHLTAADRPQFVAADIKRVESLVGKTLASDSRAATRGAFVWNRDISELLERAMARGKGRTQIIYIKALATGSPEGGFLTVLESKQAVTEATRFYTRELLDALAESRSRNTLVVLDLFRDESTAVFGALWRDFLDDLRLQFRQSSLSAVDQNKNIWILCSFNDPLPSASAADQGNAFALAVASALMGPPSIDRNARLTMNDHGILLPGVGSAEATPWWSAPLATPDVAMVADTKQEKVISVAEFVYAVQSNVGKWSRQRSRGLRMPICLRVGNDFDLVPVVNIHRRYMEELATSSEALGTPPDGDASPSASQPQTTLDRDAPDEKIASESIAAANSDTAPQPDRLPAGESGIGTSKDRAQSYVLSTLGEYWQELQSFRSKSLGGTYRPSAASQLMCRLRRIEDQLLTGQYERAIASLTGLSAFAHDVLTVSPSVAANRGSVVPSIAVLDRPKDTDPETLAQFSAERDQIAAILSAPEQEILDAFRQQPFVITVEGRLLQLLTKYRLLSLPPSDLELDAVRQAVAVRQLAARSMLAADPFVLELVKRDLKWPDAVRCLAERNVLLGNFRAAQEGLQFAQAEYTRQLLAIGEIEQALRDVDTIVLGMPGFLNWPAVDQHASEEVCGFLDQLERFSREPSIQQLRQLHERGLWLRHSAEEYARDAVRRENLRNCYASLNWPFLDWSLRQQLIETILTPTNGKDEPRPWQFVLEDTRLGPGTTSLDLTLNGSARKAVRKYLSVANRQSADEGESSLDSVSTRDVAAVFASAPEWLRAGSVWQQRYRMLAAVPWNSGSRILEQSDRHIAQFDALWQDDFRHLEEEKELLAYQQLENEGTLWPATAPVDRVATTTFRLPLPPAILAARPRPPQPAFELIDVLGKLTEGQVSTVYVKFTGTRPLPAVANARLIVEAAVKRGDLEFYEEGQVVAVDRWVRKLGSVYSGESLEVPCQIRVFGRDVGQAVANGEPAGDPRYPLVSARVEYEDDGMTHVDWLHEFSVSAPGVRLNATWPDRGSRQGQIDLFPTQSVPLTLSVSQAATANQPRTFDLVAHDSLGREQTYHVSVADDGKLLAVPGAAASSAGDPVGSERPMPISAAGPLRFQLLDSETKQLQDEVQVNVWPLDPLTAFQPRIRYMRNTHEIDVDVQRLEASDSDESVRLSLQVFSMFDEERNALAVDGSTEQWLTARQSAASLLARVPQAIDDPYEVWLSACDRPWKFVYRVGAGGVRDVSTDELTLLVTEPVDKTMLVGSQAIPPDLPVRLEMSAGDVARLSSGLDQDRNGRLEAAEVVHAGSFSRSTSVELRLMVASDQTHTFNIESAVAEMSYRIPTAGLAGKQVLLTVAESQGQTVRDRREFYVVRDSPPIRILRPQPDTAFRTNQPLPVVVAADDDSYQVVDYVEFGFDKDNDGRLSDEEIVEPAGLGTTQAKFTDLPLLSLNLPLTKIEPGSVTLLARASTVPGKEGPLRSQEQAVTFMLVQPAVEEPPAKTPEAPAVRLPGAIAGAVVLSDGVPRRGAQITLRQLSADPPDKADEADEADEAERSSSSDPFLPRQALSDGQGKFRFDTIPPGTYEITAVTFLRAGRKTEVRVTAGKTTPVTVPIRLQ